MGKDDQYCKNKAQLMQTVHGLFDIGTGWTELHI